MPHRTSQCSGHSLSFRCVAIFLAWSLLNPGLIAQPDPLREPPIGRSAEPIFRAATVPVVSAVPLPQDKTGTEKFTCPEFNINANPVLTHRNAEADKWGDITVAQPKIWQFERVSALLDGLLRDVEGISLGDLTQLDPSQQNAAALKFIQSALEVGVQYDQAGAVNAANTLANYKEVNASQTQQLNEYNTYMMTLTTERDRLAAQYAAASNEVNSLQALKAAGPLTDAQAAQLADATSRQASTNASLASVNSLITGAGVAPTLTAPPTVAGTSVQKPASGSDMSSSLMGFSDMLKSLPSGVQKNLDAALSTPSYPATKKLDNFITLLYERLAREVSVLQDDLTRDPENVAFLLQFDVGLYPSKKSKNHVARVEFNLDCPGCKVYSLYPGQSSYNVANYSGSSKRTTLWGNVLTLLGFGLSASYRRQTDTLEGSLVQSIYTAGFQNGMLNDTDPRSHEKVDGNRAEQSFGWYYGAAPFEELVSQGIHTTFAMITVPRKLIYKTEDRYGNANACVPFHIDGGWANRNDPVAQDGYFSLVGRSAKIGAYPAYFPRRDPLIGPGGEYKLGKEIDPKTNEVIPDEAEAVHLKPKEHYKAPYSQDHPPPYSESVLTMMTSVPLPASLEDYSLIARREQQKLHVLRMEYYTVYDQPEPDAKATAVQTTVQTSVQSTSPVTGQTTAQKTSQSTASVVATGSSASAKASEPDSTTANPLQCAKAKCAPILLKLDRPIDPNLVVTVRGEQLPRVRDWRGRATSLLPPAQSGTDLSGAASSAGSLTMSQLELTRGLLESDKFTPNTWFALNSHELLINISVEVAQESEFPIIQLADPSGSVTIPHDLRQSFTELVLDNFRLRPQTEFSIQKEIGRQNWRDSDDRTCPNGATFPGCIFAGHGELDAAISSGPFPFSTFLPLFSPEPPSRNFYATPDETGDILQIGFLARSAAQKATDTTPHFDWLSAQTRVILEDRDQDFAWSLSCDVGAEDQLDCRIPREEISRTYFNFLRACPDEDVCPGLEMDRQSLVSSLASKVQDDTKLCLTESEKQAQSLTPSLSCDQIKAELDPRWQESLTKTESVKDRVARQARVVNLAQNSDLKDFRNAFASTMQVWIEQADSEGQNVFYSREPARLGFFPISSDYWSLTSFRPWQFEKADANTVTLMECNYLPNVGQQNLIVSFPGLDWLVGSKGISKAILNRFATTYLMPEENNRPGWTRVLADASPMFCGHLVMPTGALSVDPLQINMEFPASPQPPKNRPIRTTVAVPRFRIGPYFLQNQIQGFPDLRPHERPPEAVKNLAAPHPATGAEGKPPTGSEAPADSAVNGKTRDVAPPAAPGQKENPVTWMIAIPVEHTTCADTLELDPAWNITWQWRNGLSKLEGCVGLKDPETTCAKPSASEKQQCDRFAAWSTADAAGRLSLYMEIPKPAVVKMGERINVVRSTTETAQWVVGALPDLRRLLLPSRLTLVPLGPTQFILRGENAGVIDAVAMQLSSEKEPTQITTAPGVDFALVSFTLKSASPSTPVTSSGTGGASTNSMQITVDTTKDNAGHVQLNSNSSVQPKAPAPANNKVASPAPEASSGDSTALAAGDYAVIPLIKIGTDPADMVGLQNKLNSANQTLSDAKKTQQKAKQDATAKPNDTDLKDALQKANDASDAAQKGVTTAQNALKDPKGPPLYMALSATDEKGKGFVFTVVDTKKAAPTTPPTTPPATMTTCVAPCVMAPCVASCPPPAPSTAPKTP